MGYDEYLDDCYHRSCVDDFESHQEKKMRILLEDVTEYANLILSSIVHDNIKTNEDLQYAIFEMCHALNIDTKILADKIDNTYEAA